MKNTSPKVIVSVGAIIRRKQQSETEILLIKRERYGTEWSLPKGKVKAEENLDEAFHREMSEETGFVVKKGEYAGCISYPVGEDIKINLFWFAEVEGGAFVPNDEVLEIAWVNKQDALNLMSYPELKDFLNRIWP